MKISSITIIMLINKKIKYNLKFNRKYKYNHMIKKYNLRLVIKIHLNLLLIISFKKYKKIRKINKNNYINNNKKLN